MKTYRKRGKFAGRQSLLIIIVLAFVHCFVVWFIIQYTKYGHTIAWRQGNRIRKVENKFVVEVNLANGVRGAYTPIYDRFQSDCNLKKDTHVDRMLRYNDISHDQVLERYLTDCQQRALLHGVFRPYKGYLSIAVPVIKRYNNSVVLVESTLNSLISSTQQKDISKIVIVVFLLTNDPVWIEKTGKHLYNKYKEPIDKGFIQIVRGHRNGLSKLLPFPGVESRKEKERREENFQFLNILGYAKNLSTYTLLLDEDVLCQRDYFLKILGFIKENTKPYRVWFVLNFSHSNLMGQLMKTSDSLKLIKLLVILRYDLNYWSLVEYMRGLKGQKKTYRIKNPPFRYINLKRRTFLPKNYSKI